MNDLTPRAPKHHIPTILTFEQAKALLAEVRWADLELLLKLALTTGMRLNELRGLRWSDLDFAEGTLQVNRMLRYATETSWSIEPPKTPAEQREIWLTTSMCTALQQHSNRKQEQCAGVEPVSPDDDYVFTRSPGNPLQQGDVIHSFDAEKKRIGLAQLLFHDLRPSAALFFLVLGVPLHVGATILGYPPSKEAGTEHVPIQPSEIKDALEKLDKALSLDDEL